jgi:hypothetical protein
VSNSSAALERLIALAGWRVWATVLRATDPHGPAIVRSGRLRLCEAPDAVRAALEAACDVPVAQLLDAGELPVVTLLGRDRCALVDDRLRVTFRPTFRVDLADRPPVAPQVEEPPELTFVRVARALAAELEAGFRAGLLMRPDPDPAASLRARHGAPPVEARPLGDGSVRFAVGHAAATLYPDGERALLLACVGSEVRDGRQFADRYAPLAGARYVFMPEEVARLGADIRAFLAHRWERFTRLP